MAWTPEHAAEHTQLASTWRRACLWAEVANKVQDATGDAAKAVTLANAAIYAKLLITTNKRAAKTREAVEARTTPQLFAPPSFPADEFDDENSRGRA